MRSWFEANRKSFSFKEPCFKGLVFFCPDEDVFNQVKKKLEGVEFSEWVNKAVDFNKENVKIRVMRGSSGNGIFLKGQNAYVDKIVFNTGEYEPMKGFPYVNVVGKVIKNPENMEDMGGQVTDAYQNYLEQEWIKKLRKQYKYKIYNKALKKVSLNK
jgi:peptidyl-prolyl cis-trans isomerase SurA